ncbi:hypothetical protein Acr_00g0014770 [Actinidia rufa]|uniref:Myb/SANT-like domain-containing protein n=1 Tax=Actinidia rufa TaxID=165716 RepID=A0A7J0DB07_9ERIC|nr:hypothetical protein Acr_00g0014770 [Actinidia rufa]
MTTFVYRNNTLGLDEVVVVIIFHDMLRKRHIDWLSGEWIMVTSRGDQVTGFMTKRKELMVKEVHEGNKSSTTFSKKGWKHIAEEFCDKTNKRHSGSQFRNKFNQLRTRYHRFSEMLKEPGFRWDPVLNTVIATDAVWDSYIQVNKNARRFRKKGCPMFNELGIIFGDLGVGYKDVFPLSQYPMVSADKLDVEDESTNDTPSAFPSDNSNCKDYSSESTRRCRQRSPTPTSHNRVKREARTAVVGEALKEWTEATVPSGTSER